MGLELRMIKENLLGDCSFAKPLQEARLRIFIRTVSGLKVGLSAHLSQFAVILILILALPLFAISNGFLVMTSGDDVQSNVFRAYTGLADVYARGAQTPDLVARLNAAINLTEQAKIRRENGDLVGAASLDSQAEAEVTGVLNEIPAAQQNAIQVSSMRTMTAILLDPIIVIVSTFLFYVVLRSWRAYERRRLYEMRIIEKTRDL